MRALGPGSVSSFLKVILDVFYFVLLALAGVDLLLMVAALLLSFRPDLLSHLTIEQTKFQGPWAGPMAAALLLGIGLYLIGGIVIAGRLRRIFQTLIAGDPFHPDNVRRLRIIAGALAALELGRYAAAALSHLFLAGRIHVGGGISVTSWFAVLVIVVLAEIFREGARLRGEAELTI